jgi:CDP-Glycerol:Poly(glycerophosphate) glycerophosphotransferase
MCAHYLGVWAELPSEVFSIVLFRRCDFEGPMAVSGSDEFMAQIRGLGYNYCYYDDILRRKAKFKCVVSNHKISGVSKFRTVSRERFNLGLRNFCKRVLNTFMQMLGAPAKYKLSFVDWKQYAPLQIGDYQVRFMYGADIGDGWSLQDWNEIYDLFMCHGPNDAKQIGLKFDGETALMGYPRYDAYFNEELDTQTVREEFSLDPEKKTVLWMSTLGEGASSIPGFAKVIASLFNDYNVIARPHPMAFRKEPENIQLLRSLNYIIDDNATRDMNSLYKVVDWVLCDYGGSSFGAIYLDINLLLLDVPGSDSHFTIQNSSNLEIREYFPVVQSGDELAIKRLLGNENLWHAQAAVREKLCRKYFADLKGTSSRRAAQILLNIGDVAGA